MSPAKVYRLIDGVQVRQEKFGLLFYNYRGPRLYFMPSRDLIDCSFFEGNQTVPELIEFIAGQHSWPRQWIQDRVHQVLEMLEVKGLVHGQPLC